MKPRVWIALRGEYGEGSTPIGIFTNRAAAIACCMAETPHNAENKWYPIPGKDNAWGDAPERFCDYVTAISWDVSDTFTKPPR